MKFKVINAMDFYVFEQKRETTPRINIIGSDGNTCIDERNNSIVIKYYTVTR